MPDWQRLGTVSIGVSVLFGTCFIWVVGCSGAPDSQQVRTAPFDSVFERTGEFVLEEPDSAPLTGIKSFASGFDGEFVVVDDGRPQVRFYAPDGELLRTVGRHGEGPGEFQHPTDAGIHPSGFLFVTEGEDGSVTRFTPEFAYDTSFSLPGSSVYSLDFRGDLLFSTMHNTVPGDSARPETVVYDVDGNVFAATSLVDSLLVGVPYWISFMAPIGAASEEWIVTGNYFGYPLTVHDTTGKAVALLNDPAPSWVPPERPERGAFIGLEGRGRLDQWLRNTVFIDDVEIYRDSLILVSHARGAPTGTDLWRRDPLFVDVYDPKGRKHWEEVPLPGRLLRADQYVYVLEDAPPNGWRVGAYVVRP